MSLLLLLLVARIASGVELLATDDGAGRGAAVAAILADVDRGDVRALVHLDPALVLAPLGLPEEDGRLLRHWSLALAGLVARLPADRRAHAHRLLTALWQRQPVRAGRAELGSRLAFVPAVAADLQRRADRAFDLGRFDTFLRFDERLGGTAGERRDIAAALAGDRGLGVVPDRRLAPGPLRSWPAPPVGLGRPDRWLRLGEVLIARGPFGEVLWQRRLPAEARLLLGPRFALVVAGTTSLVDSQGRASSLELPTGCRPFAVGWDRLWCRHPAGELVAHDRRGTVVGRLVLPEEPLCPPLPVAAGRWYWLTRHWLVLASGREVVASWRHDQALAGVGWRLHRLLDRVCLIGDDGTVLAVEPLQQALDAAAPAARPELLLRARQAEIAAQVAADLPTPQRWTAFAAVAAIAPEVLAPEQVTGLVEAVETGRVVPTATVARGLWMLARSSVSAARREAAGRLLPALATAQPDTWLCLEGDRWLQPADWSHGITLAGWQERGGQRRDPLRRLPADAALQARERPRLQRWSHPVHGFLRRWGARSFRLLRTGTGTEVVGFDAEAERVLWRRSWSTPDWLPSRQSSWRDGYLLVTEAQHRFHVLHPVDGELLASYRIPSALAFPGQVAVVRPDLLAVLGPIGVQTEVHLLTPAASTAALASVETIVLPGPARWAIPWCEGDEAGVLVRMQDGRCLHYPGGEPLAVPAAIRDSARPAWTAAGLFVDTGLLAAP